MKNKIKKTLSIFMAFMMLLCAVPFVAGAEEGETLTENGYTYTVENGEATITGCDENISGEIVIPSTLGGYPVTSIGVGALAYCNKITNMTMPNSLVSIGANSFEGCTSLKSIVIPNSVTSISDTAFLNCSAINMLSVSKENPVYHSDGNCIIKTKEKVLVLGCKNSVIPSDGSVTSIGNCAFSDCAGLTSVTIPDGITSIGWNAFSDCPDLRSVTIPDSVASIGAHAFQDCSNLIYVTLPKELTKINYNLFDYCSSLKNVIIPEKVTSIDYYAFRGCSSLTEIIIPDSVTEIKDSAFAYCSNATKITLSENLNSIGEDAFLRCSALTSITIPENVSQIGGYAFADCLNLSEIRWNAEKITGGFYAFENAAISLKEGLELVFGDNVIEVPDNIFNYSSKVKSITFGKKIKSIGLFAFSNNYGLKSVTISNNITSIDEKAFYHCSGLTDVTLGNNLTIIGDDAFYGCTNLTSITIPASVKEIGEKAFGYYGGKDYSTERIPNFTIYGYVGTAAETYAKENEFNFVPLTEKEVKNEASGISITYTDNAYDNDVELNVSVVTDGNAFNILNAEKGNFKKVLFDITTTIGGERVQPNGSVWVKIPLPKGYDSKNTTVYYITNNGKLEEMKSSIVDGYIIFETTHFSYYAVVEETEPSQPDNPSANCPCNCHKKGIANFFFKIILFFQRIFKKNKQCKCGIAHY